MKGLRCLGYSFKVFGNFSKIPVYGKQGQKKRPSGVKKETP